MNRRAFIAASLALPFTLRPVRADTLVSAIQGQEVQGEIIPYTLLLYLRSEPTRVDALRMARLEVGWVESSPVHMIFGGDYDRVPMAPPAMGILARRIRGTTTVGNLGMCKLDLLGVSGILAATASFTWASGADDALIPEIVDRFVAWYDTLDGETVYERDDDLLLLFPDLRPFATRVEN